MIKGIDVSQWQGIIDWKKVKNDGVEFAILKVINKSNRKEESFDRNYSGAIENGIPVGVYNYSYARSVAEAQVSAKAVLSIIEDKDIKMKVWLDVEDQVQQGIGKTLIQIINAYQAIIEGAGFEFGVYTGLYFYNTYIKPYESMISCDFWMARYPSNKTMALSENPSSTKKPSIRHNLWGWQYSSKGSIQGISGNVDLNICYATAEPNKIVSTTIYFPKYTGDSVSIIEALNSLGINSSLAYRKQIGKANGISSVGTAKANTTMLNMLKAGKLERP